MSTNATSMGLVDVESNAVSSRTTTPSFATSSRDAQDSVPLTLVARLPQSHGRLNASGRDCPPTLVSSVGASAPVGVLVAGGIADDYACTVLRDHP